MTQTIAVLVRCLLAIAILAGASAVTSPAVAQTEGAPCKSKRDYIRVGGPRSAHTLATGEKRTQADLSYTLSCNSSGPVPAIVIYSAYTDDPDLVTMGHGVDNLMDAGYAIVTVASRGAACSGGAYQPFSPTEARDGYDVIEWIAEQPWSNGKIGMMGESAAAITQLPIAALQPPSLDAIAPVNFLTDFYRDVVYPGGIYNQSVATGWQTFQTAQSAAGLALGSPHPSEKSPQVTPGCPHREPLLMDDLQEVLEPSGSLPTDDVHEVLEPNYRLQMWDTAFYTDRLSLNDLGRIEVPVHAVLAWQDDQLASRSVQLLSAAQNTWGILTNGVHGTKPSVTTTDRLAFFDRFLKDVDNSFEDTPRVKVLWETGSAQQWTTTYSQWPPPQTKSHTFFLSNPDNEATGLITETPGVGEPDRYTYDGFSGQSRTIVPRNKPLWNDITPEGHSLTYTSAPLEHDLVVLGSASLDLQLGSTAADTDIQVTLTEVRDGNGRAGTETFVQQGWLRASHRAEDPERSTETMPVHTHQADDAKALEAGANELRIEILPFGHVFRAGSRIRLTIEAPFRTPSPWWSFDALPGIATNTVFHEGDLQSKLVLSTVPGRPDDMPAAPPACGTLTGQPCRAIDS